MTMRQDGPMQWAMGYPKQQALPVTGLLFCHLRHSWLVQRASRSECKCNEAQGNLLQHGHSNGKEITRITRFCSRAISTALDQLTTEAITTKIVPSVNTSGRFHKLLVILSANVMEKSTSIFPYIIAVNSWYLSTEILTGVRDSIDKISKIL